MTNRMPIITCYAKLNFDFSDLRSLLPRRDTYELNSAIKAQQKKKATGSDEIPNET